MIEVHHPYDVDLATLPAAFKLHDHCEGFGSAGENKFLSKLNNYALLNDCRFTVIYHQILEPEIKQLYANLDFGFKEFNLDHFVHYTQHPDVAFENFVCSFNGSAHVSRKLLVAILHKFGWFDPQYCSKNFQFSHDTIDGHLSDYLLPEQQAFYNKFFTTDENFCSTQYSFGHERYDHAQNIFTLEHKLTRSFLHIVSESMATSYVPFVTEKFLYSVITRGLFLAYAQPLWHDHLEKYYGFKKYTKLFDYQFDSIKNPILRLVELTTMISKFQNLTIADWHDLYLLEQDTIEYNYHQYFSGNYLGQLHQYDN
jgi:hypothetical protein